MDYGAKLKELRMKLLITQTETADMLGVSFATVNRWENGHNEPTMKQQRAINESSLFKNNPGLLETLLLDRSTKKNLIWGTSNYKSRGVGFFETDYILPDLITGKHHGVIKPRSEKAVLEQKKRSKDMAEVFTPAWGCNKQNNLVD